MRALPIVFSMFLAASAYAQGSAVVYTPRARDLSVPTYVNATVVRVDASRHIVTFRSESGDVALATGHSALRSVGALRRGDQVLLGFDRSVRPYRVVSAFQGGEQPVGQGSGGGAVSVLGSPSLAAVAATSPVVLSSLAPCDVPGVVSAPVAGISAAVANTGVVTFMEPASPYARVIPSLPPVTTVSLMPPTASMPVMANGLFGSLATRDRDFDAAVRTLALKANEIDRQWYRYRDTCVTRTSVNPSAQRNMTDSNRDRGWFALLSNDVPDPDADDCRQQNVELRRIASDWRDVMTSVEDAARQSGLPQGTMREIRARYRVDF